MADSSIRVCIVDDDEAVRDSLRILLDAYGIDVEAFPTPSQFLNEALDKAADCLIFDLHMPEMTGLELAEHLRARKLTTPVIIITGRTDPVLAPRMERAGIAAVLAKPVGDEELVGAIHSARTAGAR